MLLTISVDCCCSQSVLTVVDNQFSLLSSLNNLKNSTLTSFCNIYTFCHLMILVYYVQYLKSIQSWFEKKSNLLHKIYNNSVGWMVTLTWQVWVFNFYKRNDSIYPSKLSRLNDKVFGMKTKLTTVKVHQLSNLIDIKVLLFIQINFRIV